MKYNLKKKKYFFLDKKEMKGLLVNRFPKQALCLASTLLLSYDTKWLSANEIEVFIYQLCLLTKEPFLIFCLKIDTQER